MHNLIGSEVTLLSIVDGSGSDLCLLVYASMEFHEVSCIFPKNLAAEGRKINTKDAERVSQSATYKIGM